LNSTDQVMFILQVILAVGPLAVYFLGLGLVNSQGHPVMVNSRADFTLLTIAFLPMIIMPVIGLVGSGLAWLGLAIVVAVVISFFCVLPGRRKGWVIYNIDIRHCRRLVELTCRKLGWSVEQRGENLIVGPDQLVISFEHLPLLSNVTLHISNDKEPAGHAGSDQLLGILRQKLYGQSMLPSLAGASLVVIGTGLLGLPMWYMFFHMEAIVEVVRDILFA